MGPARLARLGVNALVVALVALGCADDPPPRPRAPIVEETVTYRPGAAPSAVVQTTTIVEPTPARALASVEPTPTPTPTNEPQPEPFVPSSVSVDGTTVLQFQAGMARPTKLAGRDPRSTKPLGDGDAVFVQGIVEIDGRFTHCRIIRGLRAVDDEVLSAVKTWRVTPIVFHGKPAAVLYTWPIHVQPP